ncbi:MAG: DUF885 domain-containing protein [Xanthomonadales bacterium]|nr:DUF885 domain-containing protein [Xanthomonadales bacterium]
MLIFLILAFAGHALAQDSARDSTQDSARDSTQDSTRDSGQNPDPGLDAVEIARRQAEARAAQKAARETPEAQAARLSSLALLYYKNRLSFEPEAAYFSGIELDRHDGMLDNSTRSISSFQSYEGWMLQEVGRFDPEILVGTVSWITWAYLAEDLAARSRLYVCNHHLWNVNQMGGWHTRYPLLAEMQPVETHTLRSQALLRWQKFPGFIDQEIENLQLGLRRGYSAPRTVVTRVIEQVDGLLAVPIDESQLTSPARRAEDEAFAVEFTNLVSEEILPAYRRYRAFLADEYLPNAREGLSVLEIPKGRECYEASLRAYTTLDRSPEDVFELGQTTVAANRQQVIAKGMAAYGLDDFSAIIERVTNDPDDRFDSRDALLEFARAAVGRAETAMPQWFGTVPGQSAIVEPYPEYQEGTGMSARYEPGNSERPGTYRIPLYQPEEQSRGRVETTAFHEVWPGHHLQFSLAQSIPDLHEVTDLIWFSGMGEGWARYSEALAEEAGLYTTVSGPILRLAWPARGMVVDPGIHIFGWTREQAIEFMAESGRMSDKQLNDMVDRIAILPGQLTAYDSGGLEIMALRALAERELGEAFDIRRFHDALLQNGTLPLTALRQHMERWIASEHARIVAETAGNGE